METTHQSQIEKFIRDHFPELKEIEIDKVELYGSEDMVFHRPINAIYFEDGTEESEPSGIKISFRSKKAIPITVLANFCNLLCFGDHWSIDPEYGGISPDELSFRKNELDTCWHHSQITKLHDSNHVFYIIEQGFCYCS